MKTMQEVQAMLRDLQQLYTDVRLLDRDAIARIEEGARSDPNGEDPVSYTHLTLPTNSRV